MLWNNCDVSSLLFISRKPDEARCEVCGRVAGDVSRALGACRACILKDTEGVREVLNRARFDARREYSTPALPPRDEGGATCRICANECRIGPGGLGFCGLRENRDGKLYSRAGTRRIGLFTAYHDALPTNCVADWVCPGCSESGYPLYSVSPGPEKGYKNLAVFLAACSFDCVFCQNWHYRENTECLSPLRSPGELAGMVDSRTSCVCFFGGDPSPQMPFALAVSELAMARARGRPLRICWETNGSMNEGLLKKAVAVSLGTGGCMKFDLKAFDDRINQALTGTSNRATLENVSLAVELTRGRTDPPPVVASTLMVPGYVGADEVRKIAGYLACLDPEIPYSLLAFHPDYLMRDMGTTTAEWAQACVEAAKGEGLQRIKVGNPHLLS